LMVRSARAALEAVPGRYAQAAEVAGASRWRIFWSIELPLAKRGILAGLLLTFFRALGEFGATLLVAGNIPGSTQTLPLAIYSASFEGRPADAIPLILCIALLAFAGAWGAQSLSRSVRS
jgi:molybdate transport system permease protein